MKKNIIILFVLFLIKQSSFAESNDVLKNTILNVKLNDVDIKEGEDAIINILISAYPFGGIEHFQSADCAYEQVAVKEGNIFNVTSPAAVFYMYIDYGGSKTPNGLYYWIDNIYILKSGSNLTINLDKREIKFSGEGETIPNIQSQIIKHSYEVSPSDLKLINGKEYLRYLQKLDKSLDSVLQLQLSIIESNKTVLGDYYAKVLTANCYGYRYYSQLRDYDFKLRQNAYFFKIFKKYYSEKMNIRIIPKFTNQVLDAAPIYANYLIEEINVLERISHIEYGPMLPDSCISNILQEIDAKFSGTLRDKLLTIFALRTEKNENALSFFDGILKSIKTKRYSDLLVKKIKVKQNNIQFKNFNLEDETGKYYTLNNFKNKVVVLDFWFTGCENCRTLNEAMKPIVKYFSNNPQIQFVNISIDVNREVWLKSIRMGNYTHEKGINLYTNGQGANHELIRYYNITGYPTVFVIKNGLMFSSLPPRPSLNIPTGQEFSLNGERLIKLLEEAIKL